MRFIDLFAGLGGFHLALKRLGHSCVFACEINPHLRRIYVRNFGVEPQGDIRQIPVASVPSHDILCAGFPCQPFSKAGSQEGFAHIEWGDLFDYTLRIIEHRRPHYIILENVPNLEKHDEGHTWQSIKEELESVGYDVRHDRLSPHHFGIPQIRDRMFIVGSQSGLSRFAWPQRTPEAALSIRSALCENPVDARRLSPQVERCLEVWQEFLDRFPKDREFPTFPIWSMEFGATYPYRDITPYAIGPAGLRPYLGSYGVRLRDVTPDAVIAALPSHARRQQSVFPQWKVDFIHKNRRLYVSNSDWIDKWIPQIMQFPSSLQKLEWNCKGDERNVWQHVIQFRASGVRVKRDTTAPSLIAMTDTQVPIIGWEKRYMTPRECARLQSMDGIFFLPESRTAAFAALGNAVNVTLVELIAEQLLCDTSPAGTCCDETKPHETATILQ